MIFCSIAQKLNARKAALVKTKAVSEQEKPAIREGLLPCLMSSEESEGDGEFIVRPLPWRSARAADICHSLDEKYEKRKSNRSKRMTFARKTGLPSDRKKPSAVTVPGWCIKK